MADVKKGDVITLTYLPQRVTVTSRERRRRDRRRRLSTRALLIWLGQTPTSRSARAFWDTGRRTRAAPWQRSRIASPRRFARRAGAPGSLATRLVDPPARARQPGDRQVRFGDRRVEPGGLAGRRTGLSILPVRALRDHPRERDRAGPRPKSARVARSCARRPTARLARVISEARTARSKRLCPLPKAAGSTRHPEPHCRSPADARAGRVDEARSRGRAERCRLDAQTARGGRSWTRLPREPRAVRRRVQKALAERDVGRFCAGRSGRARLKVAPPIRRRRFLDVTGTPLSVRTSGDHITSLTSAMAPLASRDRGQRGALVSRVLVESLGPRLGELSFTTVWTTFITGRSAGRPEDQLGSTFSSRGRAGDVMTSP